MFEFRRVVFGGKLGQVRWGRFRLTLLVWPK